jgi:hypothetical protein
MLPMLNMDAKGAVRFNFSIEHLRAAAHFSRHVAELEQANTVEIRGAFFDEILWFSSACVLSCAASVEAYVNELFIDRAEHFPDLRPEVADTLWELIERKPTLKKFDMAFMLKQKTLLDRGSRPTEDVVALFELRNRITHFRPQWDGTIGPHAELSRTLENRFAPSPFLADTESLFPRRWATHGCTKWAVESCVEFLNVFESCAGVPARVAKHSARLSA